jgi:hypothetical protein
MIRTLKWLLSRKLHIYHTMKIENRAYYQCLLSSCVISTMCVLSKEYQLVNPTTQVALFSVCLDNCTSIQNISWNIYLGSKNATSNTTQWAVWASMHRYTNIWFFGKSDHCLSLVECSLGVIQVRTPAISPPLTNCFFPILTFSTGVLRWCTLSSRKTLRVH